MTAIDALIEKIDERGEELTTTWKRLGDHPQKLIVPEAMRQALHELGWIRDELVAISKQEQQAVKTFAEKVKAEAKKSSDFRVEMVPKSAYTSGYCDALLVTIPRILDNLLSESSRENQK